MFTQEWVQTDGIPAALVTHGSEPVNRVENLWMLQKDPLCTTKWGSHTATAAKDTGPIEKLD